MSDESRSEGFQIIGEGGDTVLSGDVSSDADIVLHPLAARMVLDNPKLTLEMITQSVFDALMSDEIHEQQEQQIESGDPSTLDVSGMIDVIGARCIDRIMDRLANVQGDDTHSEDAIRRHLEDLLTRFERTHTNYVRHSL